MSAPAAPEPPVPAPDAPALVFAHGAGAGRDHPWMRRIGQGLIDRGVNVITFDFPYMLAGRRVPDPGAVLEDAFAGHWRTVAATARGPLFAGGKSMGGRIASQAAAKGLFDPAPDGLVYLGYPLHPPGRSSQRRDRHLPAIAAPMLFVHGTRDPFGTPEEMRALVDRLESSTLEIIEGGDHSLVAPRKLDPEGNSVDRALDAVAAWIKGLPAAARATGRPPA